MKAWLRFVLTLHESHLKKSFPDFPRLWFTISPIGNSYFFLLIRIFILKVLAEFFSLKSSLNSLSLLLNISRWFKLESNKLIYCILKWIKIDLFDRFERNSFAALPFLHFIRQFFPPSTWICISFFFLMDTFAVIVSLNRRCGRLLMKGHFKYFLHFWMKIFFMTGSFRASAKMLKSWRLFSSCFKDMRKKSAS